MTHRILAEGERIVLRELEPLQRARNSRPGGENANGMREV